MQQGEIVVGLQSQRVIDDGIDIVAVEVIPHEHKQGTDAFAANGQDVAYGVVELFRFSVVLNVLYGGVDLLYEFCYRVHIDI